MFSICLIILLLNNKIIFSLNMKPTKIIYRKIIFLLVNLLYCIEDELF